jgi:glycosyltransferase involved in cell wall biosynthesis
MRVAIDATPLLGNRTGVGTFVRGAIEALVVRPDLSLVGFALTARGGLALPAGVETGRRAPAALALRAWEAGLQWPAASWLARGPLEVVHGTNFVVPPARSARVVTVHDLSAMTFPELCTPTTRRYPALIRRAIAEGAWVHTPSQFVAAEVGVLLDAPAERVRVVAHGVDRRAGDASAGRRMAGTSRYVLTLGTVEPRKDLPLLVRAWDRVAADRPDLGLVIAGPDGWGAAALGTALASARHADRIVRLGWVEAGQRQGLLAGATVFAFPSRYEGFGLPPLEAMAMGVPVVTTAAGAVPEVVGDTAVIVGVGDEDALAGALASVLDDPEMAASLTSAGLRRAGAYSWEACATGLLDLYQAACGRSAPS